LIESNRAPSVLGPVPGPFALASSADAGNCCKFCLDRAPLKARTTGPAVVFSFLYVAAGGTYRIKDLVTM